MATLNALVFALQVVLPTRQICHSVLKEIIVNISMAQILDWANSQGSHVQVGRRWNSGLTSLYQKITSDMNFNLLIKIWKFENRLGQILSVVYASVQINKFWSRCSTTEPSNSVMLKKHENYAYFYLLTSQDRGNVRYNLMTVKQTSNILFCKKNHTSI